MLFGVFLGSFSKTISSLNFRPILELHVVLQTSGQYLSRLAPTFGKFDLVSDLLDFEVGSSRYFG